jgi:hypothetical protein
MYAKLTSSLNHESIYYSVNDRAFVPEWELGFRGDSFLAGTERTKTGGSRLQGKHGGIAERSTSRLFEGLCPGEISIRIGSKREN